jgi:hypothetical protein
MSSGHGQSSTPSSGGGTGTGGQTTLRGLTPQQIVKDMLQAGIKTLAIPNDPSIILSLHTYYHEQVSGPACAPCLARGRGS